MQTQKWISNAPAPLNAPTRRTSNAEKATTNLASVTDVQDEVTEER